MIGTEAEKAAVATLRAIKRIEKSKRRKRATQEKRLGYMFPDVFSEEYEWYHMDTSVVLNKHSEDWRIKHRWVEK